MKGGSAGKCRQEDTSDEQRGRPEVAKLVSGAVAGRGLIHTRVAYPTASHPSTCANLQPPTSTSNSLNMRLSWTRLPVARHVWKPTYRRKMPSVQPQPPTLLYFGSTSHQQPA
ncbi:hypothetical protein K0M31_018201 [Melipona bicolor]|uniref:Uncharacterized protein n=1 Tax=Melipona bicolor TaxID=60889 RepID=A0AA40FCX2_9HYME|nr:hypothetical protein K0M31_018201 [Melipona bicolor]